MQEAPAQGRVRGAARGGTPHTPISELAELFEGLTPEELKEYDHLLQDELNKSWHPQPGPQMDAYYSKADLLLYGGAAGGGKSDLLVGLALCEHERSVLFRRQSSDLDGLWDRLTSVAGGTARNNDNKKKLLMPNGALVEGGHLEKPRSEFSWQGRPHDFIGFDEGAQLTAGKAVFVMGWLRSTTGHRCRAVIATNPPIGGEGLWLIEFFAPWIDPLFDNPAAPGELRWAIALQDGEDIVTKWVNLEDLDHDVNGYFMDIEGEKHYALSRTFIPSNLEDNVYLKNTGYRAQISSMPEPLRSALLYGDFNAGRVDHAFQVIPTEWLVKAQARWRKNEGKPLPPMLGIAADVAQGGGDNTVLAPLHGARVEKLIKETGKATPTGYEVAALILKHRRNGAMITIDMGGGWGGGARATLQKDQQIKSIAYVGAATSGATDSSGKLQMFNKRAESYWDLREALDPMSGEELELPPDAKLTAQLTSIRWKLSGGKVLVESKDDIRKRLKASTDEADAVVMVVFNRHKAVRYAKMLGAGPGGRNPAPVALGDPLQELDR